MKKRTNRTTIRICLDAMFVTLYVVFSVLLSFKAKTIEISWASLPILVCAFLLPPVDALAVSVCGSFIEQLVSPYGLTATTPVWMLPVILQALTAALLYRAFVRKGEDKIWKFAVIIVVSELVLTAANIGASFIDAYLFDYLEYLVIDIPIRLANGGVRAVLSAILVPVLLPPLRRLLDEKSY